MAVTISQIKKLNIPAIEAVRMYAAGNYLSGWDLILEHWTDEDIAAVIGGNPNLTVVIGKLFHYVRAHRELMVMDPVYKEEVSGVNLSGSSVPIVANIT